MRKFLFAIITCCLAATTTFAQISPIKIHLDEDKPQDEVTIVDHRDYEQGHIFIKINGEPDNYGRTPVQIELENTSGSYEFLLFNHAWTKKELRKNQKVFFEKGIGDNALPIENLVLDPSKGYLISGDSKYTFPDILIEEGKTYECKIPIHLARPKPNLFSKRKKVVKGIIPYTLEISVENKDENYDKLKRECDSLLFAFDGALKREEFCTHAKHRPSFDAQIEEYTDANQELRKQIEPLLYNNSIPKESKKYKRYQALSESLDKMDNALVKYKGETHECVKCSRRPNKPKPDSKPDPKPNSNYGSNSSGNSDGGGGYKCSYCSLSLQEIYNKLVRHYQNLYNGDVQKTAIWKEVSALHRCGTTHSNSKRANGNSYKASINEFYNKIKNY